MELKFVGMDCIGLVRQIWVILGWPLPQLGTELLGGLFLWITSECFPAMWVMGASTHMPKNQIYSGRSCLCHQAAKLNSPLIPSTKEEKHITRLDRSTISPSVFIGFSLLKVQWSVTKIQKPDSESWPRHEECDMNSLGMFFFSLTKKIFLSKLPTSNSPQNSSFMFDVF